MWATCLAMFNRQKVTDHPETRISFNMLMRVSTVFFIQQLVIGHEKVRKGKGSTISMGNSCLLSWYHRMKYMLRNGYL